MDVGNLSTKFSDIRFYHFYSFCYQNEMFYLILYEMSLKIDDSGCQCMHFNLIIIYQKYQKRRKNIENLFCQTESEKKIQNLLWCCRHSKKRAVSFTFMPFLELILTLTTVPENCINSE